MSLMPLVLCVPARRLASCQFTMRARMSRRTGTPNTSSARSMSPTSALSRFLIVIFMSLALHLGRLGRGRARLAQRRRERQILGRLALRRILDEDVAAFGAGDRALDHDEAARLVRGDDAEILDGDALTAP